MVAIVHDPAYLAKYTPVILVVSPTMYTRTSNGCTTNPGSYASPVGPVQVELLIFMPLET